MKKLDSKLISDSVTLKEFILDYGHKWDVVINFIVALTFVVGALFFSPDLGSWRYLVALIAVLWGGLALLRKKLLLNKLVRFNERRGITYGK